LISIRLGHVSYIPFVHSQYSFTPGKFMLNMFWNFPWHSLFCIIIS